MRPIDSGHSCDGARTRSRVRHDQQLAGTEVNTRHVPAEERVSALARRRQRPQAAHLPDLVSQTDFHSNAKLPVYGYVTYKLIDLGISNLIFRYNIFFKIVRLNQPTRIKRTSARLGPLDIDIQWA